MGALSQGCGTCKRRKVKCDETHPHCARCQTSGLECSGFVTRLRFVDEGPRLKRRVRVSLVQSSKQPVSSLLAVPCSQHYRLRPALANTLPLTAFKDDIHKAYLIFKLFERSDQLYHADEAEARCGISTDWLPALLRRTTTLPLRAWDAVAAVVFGRAHECQYSIAVAQKAYGQALSDLRCQLSRFEESHADDALASLTALYMYEMLATSYGQGWMAHADGLGWLLRQKGPREQKHIVGKSTFLEHRMVIICKSIISGQSTFLSDTAWTTLPWEDDPESKTDIDYLVDIGADTANYIAQARRYKDDDSDHESLLRLRKQVTASLEELNAWWQEWNEDQSHPTILVVPHQQADGSTFPTLLEYDTPWTAFTVCVHNAIRILLLQLWTIIKPPSDPNTEVNRSIILELPIDSVLLGITSDIKGLANEILRSLSYAYRMSPRIIFSCSFFFIRDVAFGCFAAGSKEAMWAVRCGWAETASSTSIEDMNLMRNMPTLGQIKVQLPFV